MPAMPAGEAAFTSRQFATLARRREAAISNSSQTATHLAGNAGCSILTATMAGRRALSVLFAAACLASAGTAVAQPDAHRGALLQRFEASAAAHGLPKDLLLAIAKTEGGLTIPAHRRVLPDAHVPAAGPLQLRHGRFDSLARGAALMGTTELALREDADLALEAGARVLAELGVRLGADARDLASWGPALEELGGYADDAHRLDYAHRVLDVLAKGGSFRARDGETIVLPPHDIPARIAPRPEILPADYGPAEWFPTPETNKWTTGRDGIAVDRIVIHDTEGGWDASVATLQNDPGKSVHYIVGTDGTVGQFVHEADTAWHAGNWFYNEHSVGIEHVGYYEQAYPDALYAASATLVKYLTAKYAVPKDRDHIIGHDQIPNGNVMPESNPACESAPAVCETGTSYGGDDNHRDPGDFEWCLYMVQRVGGTCKCDDVGASWTCSSDQTEAYRCANGAVEIEPCDGPGACESSDAGTNVVCHTATAASDAGPSRASDAGARVDAGRVEHDAGSAEEGASAGDAGGGCSVGGTGEGWWLGLGPIAIFLGRLRRRYHRVDADRA